MPSNLVSPALSAYTTLQAQCLSKDGAYLAVGQSDPNCRRPAVCVFDVVKVLSKEGDAIVVRFSLDEQEAGPWPVLSMCSTQAELIVGSVGRVCAYPWKSLTKRSPKQSWRIDLPASSGTPTEANWLDSEEASGTAGRLYVAGGDGCAHVFDLETRTPLHCLRGHESFLHGLAHEPGSGALCTAGEDGTVRVWAPEQKRPCQHVLKPHERPELQRSRLGKWVGAVDMTAEWVVCGGGPLAALWHLRTLSPQDPLPPLSADAGVHVAKLHNDGDRVIIGGECNTLYQTTLTGSVLAEVTVSSSCVYSVACQDAPARFLAAAGASNRIDICAPNFSYKDQTIEFPLN